MLLTYLFKSRHKIKKSADVKAELLRQLFSIRVNVFGVFAIFTLAIFDYNFGLKIIAISNFITTFIFIFTLFLFSKGHSYLPRTILFLATFSTLVFDSSFIGPHAGSGYIWFPLLCAVFLLFDMSKKKYVYTFLSLIFIGIIFLEITDYSLFLSVQPSNFYIRYYKIICFIISLSLVGFYVYSLIFTNLDFIEKLRKLNLSFKKSNQELIKTNQELDSFVYKASHDLRAPLTSLLGLIQISRMENDISKINEYLSLSEKSVRKLDSFIIDILNISKNERLGLELESIRFEDMIKSMFEQMEHFENASKLKRNIRIDQKNEFYTDYKRLSIVCNNLISNAISYADLNKPTSILNINIEVTEKYAELSFIDNGVGIKEQQLSKVYNMFYRAATGGNGSGLGLYIVNETVEKLKGTIEINSEYGKWTHVKLHLPNLKSI